MNRWRVVNYFLSVGYGRNWRISNRCIRHLLIQKDLKCVVEHGNNEPLMVKKCTELLP